VADFSKRTQYGTIRALTLPAQAVSATAIRQALAAGQPCAGLLAPAVVDYINQQHLYGR
jgi:nicotinate-nucleotide adenylyltransferase